MIYITGDTHGTIDSDKLEVDKFPEQTMLTKKDYVIIAGDFGYIFSNNSKEKETLKQLEYKNYTTLFVDGNHECFPTINNYPVEEWHGGKVHKINDSVYHLMRGQVFNIDNKKIFTFGGGESVDKEYRIEHISWWPEEMPNHSEFEEGMKNLEKNHWQVDYIITHACHDQLLQMMAHEHKLMPITNSLGLYLDHICRKTKFKQWYFGHYHVDKSYSDKYFAVFNNIHRI